MSFPSFPLNHSFSKLEYFLVFRSLRTNDFGFCKTAVVPVAQKYLHPLPSFLSSAILYHYNGHGPWRDRQGPAIVESTRGGGAHLILLLRVSQLPLFLIVLKVLARTNSIKLI